MKIGSSLLLLLFLLTGCWDQRLLKDARLIYAVSFDRQEDGKLHSSAVIRSVHQMSGQGGGTPVNEYIFASANTPRQTRQKMDSKIAGEFDASKNRVIMLGEKLAKEDIYPLLDIFYRDPESSLGAMIAVIDGKADDVIKMRHKDQLLIGEYTMQLLKSGQTDTYLPIENVQVICPILFDPGRDVALPLLKKSQSYNELTIKGLALMNNHRYSGVHLTTNESTLMLLMDNKKGNIARFTRKVNPSEKNKVAQFVTIDVLGVKATKYITQDSSGKLHVKIKMHLKVEAIEYPKDHLVKPEVISFLNNKLSTILTKESNETLTKLQKANSDTLGIGRELIARHPEIWKQLDWEKDYSKIDLTAKVSVNIVDHGIVN